MDSKKMLESRVKRFSGEYGDEIIGLVKILAEIDVRIKNAMDEIERIDNELVRRHNELSDKINGLIEKSVISNGDSDSDESLDSSGSFDSACTLKIELKI